MELDFKNRNFLSARDLPKISDQFPCYKKKVATAIGKIEILNSGFRMMNSVNSEAACIFFHWKSFRILVGRKYLHTFCCHAASSLKYENSKNSKNSLFHHQRHLSSLTYIERNLTEVQSLIKT